MRLIWLIFSIYVLYGCEAATTRVAHDTGDDNYTSEEILESLKLGAPPINKKWAPIDYINFDIYLTKVDENKYPKLKESKLSPLFEKYIDSINQNVYKNDSIDLVSRLNIALQLQQSLKNTMLKYFLAMASGEPYSLEVAHLLGLILVSVNESLPMMNKFKSGLDPTDSSYEVRMAGFAQMNDGLATILQGCLASLTEKHTYTDEDRLVVAKYLSIEAPAILEQIGSHASIDLRYKIESIIQQEQNKQIKQYLSAI